MRLSPLDSNLVFVGLGDVIIIIIINIIINIIKSYISARNDLG